MDDSIGYSRDKRESKKACVGNRKVILQSKIRADHSLKLWTTLIFMYFSE